MSTLQEFIRSRVVFNPRAKTRAVDLFNTYDQWFYQGKPLSRYAFTRSIKPLLMERGARYGVHRFGSLGSQNGFYGIEIIPGVSPIPTMVSSDGALAVLEQHDVSVLAAFPCVATDRGAMYDLDVIDMFFCVAPRNESLKTVAEAIMEAEAIAEGLAARELGVELGRLRAARLGPASDYDDAISAIVSNLTHIADMDPQALPAAMAAQRALL